MYVTASWCTNWEGQKSQIRGTRYICTVLVLRMAHGKWKETKQQPSMLPGPAVTGCCLVYFHILWAILSTSTVLRQSKSSLKHRARELCLAEFSLITYVNVQGWFPDLMLLNRSDIIYLPLCRWGDLLPLYSSLPISNQMAYSEVLNIALKSYQTTHVV